MPRQYNKRIRKEHQDDVRRKIQCSQLINRLMQNIEGEIELNSTQVRSIEILMNKSLPNLSDVRMDMTGNKVTFNLSLGSEEQEDQESAD